MERLSFFNSKIKATEYICFLFSLTQIVRGKVVAIHVCGWGSFGRCVRVCVCGDGLCEWHKRKKLRYELLYDENVMRYFGYAMFAVGTTKIDGFGTLFTNEL